jgi:hypothetical protein
MEQGGQRAAHLQRRERAGVRAGLQRGAHELGQLVRRVPAPARARARPRRTSPTLLGSVLVKPYNNYAVLMHQRPGALATYGSPPAAENRQCFTASAAPQAARAAPKVAGLHVAHDGAVRERAAVPLGQVQRARKAQQPRGGRRRRAVCGLPPAARHSALSCLRAQGSGARARRRRWTNS